MQPFTNPTLGSVLMVEKAVKRHSGELGKYQLWRRLPKKMTYQTFQCILDYLSTSQKILVDKGKVVWIWDPEGIARLRKKGVTLY